MQNCATLKSCSRKQLSPSWMRVSSALSKEEWKSDTVTRFTSEDRDATIKAERCWITQHLEHYLFQWDVIFWTRDCQDLSNAVKDLEKHKSTYVHFKGGVNMGIGSFNLVRALKQSHPIQCYCCLTNKCDELKKLPHFCPDVVSVAIQSPQTDGVSWLLWRQGIYFQSASHKAFSTLFSIILNASWCLPGTWFVWVERRSHQRQPTLYSQRLNSPHVSPLHHCDSG